MELLEIAVFAILLFVTIEQAIAVAIFLGYCRKRFRSLPDAELPDVLVVLALRGCDPTLEDCLRALFRQDYPRYRVRVMVDNRSDPAWRIAQRMAEELSASHVEIRPLESPSTTCTLKCTALLQATADLANQVGVVAFLDADVAPSATWLRDLVAPLADPRCEAAMGNRWYFPPQGWWGSLVRHLWNASSVVNMFYWQVPWGGTLAVKADVLRQSALRDQWSRAGCDDVPLFNILRQRRRRMAFVPTLLLANQDECRLASSLRFMSRQLLWVRLYHPVCWWVCAFFHVLLVVAQALAVFLAGWAGWRGDGRGTALLASAVAVNAVVTFLMMLSLEKYAARVTSVYLPRSWAFWLKMLVAIPLTEIVSLDALTRALFCRQVEWRGITYRIGGPWKIRMLEYLPTRDGTADNDLAQPADGRLAALASIPGESRTGVS